MTFRTVFLGAQGYLLGVLGVVHGVGKCHAEAAALQVQWLWHLFTAVILHLALHAKKHKNSLFSLWERFQGRVRLGLGPFSLQVASPVPGSFSALLIPAQARLSLPVVQARHGCASPSTHPYTESFCWGEERPNIGWARPLRWSVSLHVAGAHQVLEGLEQHTVQGVCLQGRMGAAFRGVPGYAVLAKRLSI